MKIDLQPYSLIILSVVKFKLNMQIEFLYYKRLILNTKYLDPNTDVQLIRCSSMDSLRPRVAMTGTFILILLALGKKHCKL